MTTATAPSKTDGPAAAAKTDAALTAPAAAQTASAPAAAMASGKSKAERRSYTPRPTKSVEARLLNSNDLRDYFALSPERRAALEVLLGRGPSQTSSQSTAAQLVTPAAPVAPAPALPHID